MVDDGAFWWWLHPQPHLKIWSAVRVWWLGRVVGLVGWWWPKSWQDLVVGWVDLPVWPSLPRAQASPDQECARVTTHGTRISGEGGQPIGQH